MICTETRLKGAFIIELERCEDERGFFARSFCQQRVEQSQTERPVFIENAPGSQITKSLRPSEEKTAI